MNHTVFDRATHFSVVWAIMLCFITIIEWRSLDRDPLKKDILSPFIQRDIQVSSEPSATGSPAAQGPQYTVEFHFNGPLFLACFFIPIIGIHGAGILLKRLQNR